MKYLKKRHGVYLILFIAIIIILSGAIFYLLNNNFFKAAEDLNQSLECKSLDESSCYEIYVSTNKKIYRPGEEIKLSVKNNLGAPLEFSEKEFLGVINSQDNTLYIPGQDPEPVQFKVANNNIEGWRLVSFPQIKETDVKTYFANSSFNPEGRIFTWNSTAKRYDSYNGDESSKFTISSGKGYWIYTTAENSPNDMTFEVLKPFPQEVPLEMGWNMAGNPFNSSLKTSNITVKLNTGKTISLQEAGEKSLTSDYIFTYDSARHSYSNIDLSIDSNSEIPSQSGFWFSVLSTDVVGIYMTSPSDPANLITIGQGESYEWLWNQTADEGYILPSGEYKVAITNPNFSGSNEYKFFVFNNYVYTGDGFELDPRSGGADLNIIRDTVTYLVEQKAKEALTHSFDDITEDGIVLNDNNKLINISVSGEEVLKFIKNNFTSNVAHAEDSITEKVCKSLIGEIQNEGSTDLDAIKNIELKKLISEKIDIVGPCLKSITGTINVTLSATSNFDGKWHCRPFGRSWEWDFWLKVHIKGSLLPTIVVPGNPDCKDEALSIVEFETDLFNFIKINQNCHYIPWITEGSEAIVSEEEFQKAYDAYRWHKSCSPFDVPINIIREPDKIKCCSSHPSAPPFAN